MPANKALGDVDYYEDIDVEKLLGCIPRPTYVTHNNIFGVKTERVIQFSYDDEFTFRYSKTNKAAVAATNNKLGHGWRGPLVAYCGYTSPKTISLDLEYIVDFDMHAFSDLVAHLINHLNTSHDHQLRKGPKVKAVKLNCGGERRTNSAAEVESVHVPTMHPIFDKGGLSGISKNIGIPLLLMKDAHKKYPPPPQGYHGPTDYMNEKATFMTMACDPKAARSEGGGDPFGWAPLHWLGGEVPNVLIVRLDRKPLEPDTVEAFGDFCQFHLAEYMQWQMEAREADGADEAAIKQTVMEQMTPVNWAKYFSQWQKKKSGSVVDLVEGMESKVVGLDEESGEKLVNRLLGIH